MSSDGLAAPRIDRSRRKPRLAPWVWLAGPAIVVAVALSPQLVGKMRVVDVRVAPAVRVSAATGEVLDGSPELSAAGYVVADRQSVLATKFTGRLAKLNVAEAESVTKGQVVAEIDHSELDATILEAERKSAKPRRKSSTRQTCRPGRCRAGRGQGGPANGRCRDQAERNSPCRRPAAPPPGQGTRRQPRRRRLRGGRPPHGGGRHRSEDHLDEAAQERGGAADCRGPVAGGRRAGRRRRRRGPPALGRGAGQSPRKPAGRIVHPLAVRRRGDGEGRRGRRDRRADQHRRLDGARLDRNDRRLGLAAGRSRRGGIATWASPTRPAHRDHGRCDPRKSLSRQGPPHPAPRRSQQGDRQGPRGFSRPRRAGDPPGNGRARAVPPRRRSAGAGNRRRARQDRRPRGGGPARPERQLRLGRPQRPGPPPPRPDRCEVRRGSRSPAGSGPATTSSSEAPSGSPERPPRCG